MDKDIRLMLGRGGKPQLLVEVHGNYDPKKFCFWVVNGAWDGRFEEGSVVIVRDETIITGVEILCSDQDRLRGDYQEVFDNFHNENYIAPSRKYRQLCSDFDDDIPF